MTTPKTTQKRGALYARVSTLDRHQDPETQLRQLREHAQHRGFAIADEFIDYASGRDNARAEYGKLLDAARRRDVDVDVDVVLVWRYDRFGGYLGNVGLREHSPHGMSKSNIICALAASNSGCLKMTEIGRPAGLIPGRSVASHTTS